jgi:hypothetical protein
MKMDMLVERRAEAVHEAHCPSRALGAASVRARAGPARPHAGRSSAPR